MKVLDRRQDADRASGRPASGSSRPSGAAARRSRRRFARRQWARRWLTWRYVAALLVVVLLVGGGAYAVGFSPWLAAEKVSVTGATTLTREQVLRSADVDLGEPLARLDLDAVAIRVRSLAAVRSVEVTRHWPDEVRISVEEREPVAVVAMGDQLRALDVDGVMFGDYRRPPADLPLVESAAGTGGAALREAATVAGALEPAFLATVDHLEVTSVDQITLALRDGRLVRWGSAEQSEQKATVLAALLARRSPVYDVSVPTSPVTAPR